MEHNKKHKKGFGLLESMIAIGVFGVTIVIGLSLIVKSLAIIKDNQISDQSASFMVSSLEYVKSPNFELDTILNGTHYKIDFVDNEIKDVISTTSNEIDIDSCDETSQFSIDIDGDKSRTIFCNQITITYVDASDPDNSDFLITSRVVYSVSDGFKQREMIGFKKRL